MRGNLSLLEFAHSAQVAGDGAFGGVFIYGRGFGVVLGAVEHAGDQQVALAGDEQFGQHAGASAWLAEGVG